MSQDSRYSPVPFVYRSKGLIARYVSDQVPEFFYLDMLNCLERAENSISSRYGYRILTRDLDYTAHGQNYFFSSPPRTLAKLTFAASGSAPAGIYRYAGLADGTLYRRSGNDQGAYSQIYAGLSGDPMQTVVTACFETSQPYSFFYDSRISIKDAGGAIPLLTGIDRPLQPVNTLPYSPLLTLIDNFAQTNTYVTANFTTPFAYTPVASLTPSTAQQVTDFPEFLGITNGTGGGAGGPYQPATGHFSTTYGATKQDSGQATQTSPVFSNFPALALSLVDTVTLTVATASFVGFQLGNSGIFTKWASGTGTINYQYSLDSGVTWTTFNSYSQSVPNANPTNSAPVLTPNTITSTVSGLTNLNQLQIRFVCNTIGVRVGSGGPFEQQTLAKITLISAAVDSAGAADPFDGVVDGMLSVLADSASTPTGVAYPPAAIVVNIISQDLVSGLYRQLLVNTASGHNYLPGDYCSVYGCTSDLVDGFYQVVATPSPTSFVVSFTSASYINAAGGLTYGGASAGTTNPATCVIANHQSTPNPSQFSAWGFYKQVGAGTSSFPVGAWSGVVAQNTTSSSPATVTVTRALDLSQGNQVTDDDLIVLTLLVSDPAAVENIRLQFDVRGSDYTSSFYYKDISPAYYQQGVEGLQDAYNTTEQQILADSLGLISGTVPNTITSQLQPGNLSTGRDSWQRVLLRRGDFVPVGTAGQPGLDWSAITGWQLVITTTTVGSTTVATNGLYLQWGYGPSSFAGVGYDYRVTYYNANTGTEGNGSQIQTFNKQFGWLSSQSAPIFLRQAVQVVGLYSSDIQVTHVRVYRRGGIYGDNWRQIDQIANVGAEEVVVGGGKFFIYKDVIEDAVLAEAAVLVLDNDPPVTSNLRVPIQTTMTTAPVTAGSTIYSVFSPQIISVADAAAIFVIGQQAIVGNANNLELVTISTAGVGQFGGVFRLQHNAGEQVSVFATPRTPCNLAALAYNQVWLAGDKANPNYLYFSKTLRPENFGPQNYIAVGSSNYPIVIVVNWRGTLFVATTQTWWQIVGGANPYPQPTGAVHGAVSSTGWTQDESKIVFRAADGDRSFSGADGAYLTLPVEFVLQGKQSLTPVPVADQTAIAADVLCYFNNQILASYVSQQLDVYGQPRRFRLVFDTRYQRFRYDDVAATAMLWERDTNQLLAAVPAPPTYSQVELFRPDPSNPGRTISYFVSSLNPPQWMIVLDQQPTQDYDDGGWMNGSLVQQEISLALQLPYEDLGQPHFPKQWNVLETDVNTAGADMQTEMLFDTEPPASLTLASANTGNLHQKVQLKISDGVAAADGFEAYSASIRHTMAVVVAPVFYQENIYAEVLADYRSSWDTYWIGFNTDESKIVRESYFDYTSSEPITVRLYADGVMTNPYFMFVLPARPERAVVRVIFPAWKPRRWRMIGVCDGSYQFWSDTTIEVKTVKEGSTFSVYEVKQ